MTISDANDITGGSQQTRPARVVVLGEFSAGKSTLINLLTGEQSLRTQVTATQMPAVWMSYGTDDPYRVDLEGNEHPVDPTKPESISVTDTAYVRTFLQAPALEICDLIDTPGNSDPNIASIAWERVAGLADVAIWCSPSTQAWRQSELSAWREVPESVRARSILLLTRADKLTTDEDRAKVLSRANREAGELFTHIHMTSLIEFDNAREILQDLIELCNSVETTDPIGAQVASHFIGNIASDTTAEPTQSHEKAEVTQEDSEAMDEPSTTEATVSDEQMTDDMLIDSLDLSEEASLDEFAMDEDADMDEVLAALSAPPVLTPSRFKSEEPVETIATPEPQAEPESSVGRSETEVESEPTIEAVESGFASALWDEMSGNVPPGDQDAYYAMFDTFLEKLDTEIEMLRNQAPTKAVG